MNRNSTTGPVYLESATVEMQPEAVLVLSGSLPTPCHRLQVDIQPPDAENRIHVQLSSRSDPDVMCTQVLAPFTERISLGDLPSGTYQVWVNGKLGPIFQVP